VRNQCGAEFYKHWVELENKKDRLFQQGYSPMWELDLNKHGLDKTQVTNSKDISKYLMLPKVPFFP
jgi:hypothetical protein